MRLKNSPSYRRLKKFFLPEIAQRRKDYAYEQGAECVYYEFEGYGLKVYGRFEDRDFAYDQQHYAYDYGLAPAVYGKITLQGKAAYFTQIAQPVEYWDRYSEEADDLIQQLIDIGISYTDLHCGNVGTINGETVVIDFGPLGIS